MRSDSRRLSRQSFGCKSAQDLKNTFGFTTDFPLLISSKNEEGEEEEVPVSNRESIDIKDKPIEEKEEQLSTPRTGHCSPGPIDTNQSQVAAMHVQTPFFSKTLTDAGA